MLRMPSVFWDYKDQGSGLVAAAMKLAMLIACMQVPQAGGSLLKSLAVDSPYVLLHACRVMRAEYSIPKTPAVSQECKDLVAGLLVVDPEQRMALEDLLQNPWFT